MRTPSALPFPFNQAPFTIDQARLAGISRGRCRAPDLLIPSKGLRWPAAVPIKLSDNCRTLTSVTPESFVSHISAAMLHGLFLPGRHQQSVLVDLARILGSGRPRRKNVRGHLVHLSPGDLTMVDGIPVTSVQRTLLDLSTLLSVDELVVIADQLVCAHEGGCVPFKNPWVELHELQRYVVEHAGFKGVRKLRAAMDLVRVGSDSAPETALRLLIHRSPLPNFAHNIELKNGSGWALVQPDLACRQYKTCAEYDGLHHFSPEQQAKDHERDFATKSLGWHQILINKTDMRSGDWVVVTKIARMLKVGGWPDPDHLADRPLPGRFG